jgi:hypothetical protein
MATKFFLVYLGSLLACSIVLFTLVKQFAAEFAAGGKKPVLYGGFSSIVASLAAYGATYVTNNLFTVFWIFTGIFLSFGILHMIITHKKYFSPKEETDTRPFIGEIIFAMSVVLFTIAVFSSLQYFLTDDGKSFLFYPMMMSTLAFFVPVLVSHTFDAAFDIPPPVYPTWVYPDKPIDLPDDDPREKLLVIGFEIAKKIKDTKRTYFRAKAPESIYFGDLYYFFINDYNEVQSETPIEFCDNDDSPCEWIFRLKTRWYQGMKIIDPALTVKDNGIRENSVIICERV